jgi:DNA-directed RNA polymerase specialized sigma24 family protein
MIVTRPIRELQQIMQTLTQVKKSVAHPIRFERDLISILAARAEQEAGYTPGKVGWLVWFGKILRGEATLLPKLRDAAQSWPPLEREIFEYYFVDRLTLADIALKVGCTAKAFHAHLRFIQRRLREALVKEVLSESRRIVVDNWTLRLKCGKCGNGREQNNVPAMSHA